MQPRNPGHGVSTMKASVTMIAACLLALPALGLSEQNATIHAGKPDHHGCAPWWTGPNHQGGSADRHTPPHRWQWPWYRPHTCKDPNASAGNPNSENPVGQSPAGSAGTGPETDGNADPGNPLPSPQGSNPVPSVPNPQAPSPQPTGPVDALPLPTGLPATQIPAPEIVVAPDGTSSLAVGYGFIPVHSVSICADGSLAETCDASTGGPGGSK